MHVQSVQYCTYLQSYVGSIGAKVKKMPTAYIELISIHITLMFRGS